MSLCWIVFLNSLFWDKVWGIIKVKLIHCSTSQDKIFIRYTPRVSVVAGLGQFSSSVKAVLVEKLEGVQCIEPVKSRVPTYDFYRKKLDDFLVF